MHDAGGEAEWAALSDAVGHYSAANPFGGVADRL